MTIGTLQASWEIEDLDRRFAMLIWRRIAATPDDAYYLLRSDGRRRTGRPRRYWLVRDMRDKADWTKTFCAESDSDALAKARAKLAQL